MAQTIQRQRIIGNPGERRARKRSRNPGEILGFVLAPAGNPGRKRGNMAKAKANRGRVNHSKHNPGTRRRKLNTSHRRKLNTSHRHHHKKLRKPGRMKVRRHHRRNPGEMSGIGPMFTNAVFVIVGALGSKLGAQAVLGTNNVGVVGYAGNAATGAILWFLAEKVMKNKAAAAGIVAGTLVQIILRVINDYTPFGQYVSNLGMGDYQMQSFVTPQVLVDPWRNANVQIPQGWGAARPMSASAGPSQVGPSQVGPSHMGGRRAIAAAPSAASAAATAPSGAPSATGVSGMGGLYGGGMTSLYG